MEQLWLDILAKGRKQFIFKRIYLRSLIKICLIYKVKFGYTYIIFFTLKSNFYNCLLQL